MKEKSTPPAGSGISTRPRIRARSGPSAITLTVLHTLSIIACLVAIGAAAYATNRAKGDEKVVMIGTFVAAFWALGVDIMEIAAFFDRSPTWMWQCPERFLYLVELITAVFCFGLPAASMLGLDAARYERCRYVRYQDMEKEGCRSSPGEMEGGRMVGFIAIYVVA